MSKDSLYYLEYKQLISDLSNGKEISDLDFQQIRREARQFLCQKHGKSDSGMRGMISRGAKEQNPQSPTGVSWEWEQINDTQTFRNHITKKLVKEEPISVCMLNDIHFPFQNDLAIDLAIQVIKYTQPTYFILGSDDEDNTQTSSYGSPNELKDFNWYDENPKYHQNLVMRIKEASPNSQGISILGNHNRRVQDYINNKFSDNPSLRNQEIRKWIENIQMDGLVYYIPSNHVVIGDILYMHESKGGDAGAKANFKNNGYRHSQHGHVHRGQKYGEQTAHGYKTCVVTGCLCKHPHYDTGKAHSQWTLGIGYSIQWNGIVEQNPIDFHEQEDYLCCWIGNEKLEISL